MSAAAEQHEMLALRVEVARAAADALVEAVQRLPEDLAERDALMQYATQSAELLHRREHPVCAPWLVSAIGADGRAVAHVVTRATTAAEAADAGDEELDRHKVSRRRHGYDLRAKPVAPGELLQLPADVRVYWR